MRTLTDALDDFIRHYTLSLAPLYEPWDPDWRSPCELAPPEMLDGAEVVRWEPVRQDNPDVLTRVETALETTIHPDLKLWWGRWFSAHLSAHAPDGALTLLQVWNADDIERLIANQLGHALNQKRAKAPLALFFACPEDGSDLQLTVHNQTGEVLLEAPGRKPLRVVAPSLASFVDELVPGVIEQRADFVKPDPR